MLHWHCRFAAEGRAVHARQSRLESVGMAVMARSIGPGGVTGFNGRLGPRPWDGIELGLKAGD